MLPWELQQEEGSRLVRGFFSRTIWLLAVTGLDLAKQGSYMTLHEENSETPELSLSRLGSNTNCLSDSL